MPRNQPRRRVDVDVQRIEGPVLEDGNDRDLRRHLGGDLDGRTCIATKSDGCMPSGPASFSGSWWRVKKTGADSAPSGRSMPVSQSSRAAPMSRQVPAA